MTELVARLPNLPETLGIEPGDALVTLSHARLGEAAFGISPGEAWVMATLRSRTDELQEILMTAARDMAVEAAGAAGLGVDIETAERFAACFNDAGATTVVREACAQAGIACAGIDGPFRWSEDFGVFGSVAPSAFFVLGAGEGHPQLHNPDYDFPDEIIPTALAIFETVARQQCG
jgi:metal-dependent amidase/aminoacylase/carboxypeptidase family protein